MNWRSVKEQLVTIGAAVFAVAMFYVLFRMGAIIEPAECFSDRLFGGAAEECKAAARAASSDPWAPFALVAWLLVVVGLLLHFIYTLVRDRQWKGVALAVVWILGLIAISTKSCSA